MSINKSLVSLISTLGNNIVYAEIGVYKGASLLSIATNCPNVTSLYGIDFYKDYYMQEQYYVSKSLAEYNKKLVLDKIKDNPKIKLHVMPASEAVELFKDASIDVLYLDDFIDKDVRNKNINEWKIKLKDNGIFCWRNGDKVDWIKK